MKIDEIKALILLAYEIGRWRGQVDLEESMDMGQYTTCLLESIIAKKTAMPISPSSQGRTVSYNLRSDKWREGVEKTCKNKIDKLISYIT